MGLILLIVLLLILFGGGFGYYQGHAWTGAPWAGPGLGLGGILLIIVVVLLLTGRL